tara:strand:+ start:2093 stop:3337 length:1245 start_codon:yes stop_codon:yes gene_type:complete
MAKKFLIDVDLAKNELQNAVIQPLASAPSSPVEGQIYYNTSDDSLYIYNGSAWSQIGAGAYTNEEAQDAVGSILVDSSELNFTYNDATPSITAALVAGSVDESKLDTSVNASLDLADSAVQPGDLSTVATTGSYNDLSDKPTIPSTLAELDTTVTGSELNGIKTKTDNITVTQAVDLDAIETRVNSLDAAVVLSGSWDASGGSFPGGGSAQAGESYIVSTGGTVDGVEFNANDRIVSITDNASTTTYASNWLKLDYTDEVLSVNSQTGAVVLDADDIDDTSTTNKFVTAADITKLGNLSGTNTGDEQTATTSAEGVVELATQAEAQAKSASNRALTPASVADFARKYTGLIGDNSNTSIAVTHGLGSQYVTAQVYDASSNAQVECDVTLTSGTQTTFTFATAPTTDQYRVVITG